MSSYRYTRHAFRSNGTYHPETVELSEEDLLLQAGKTTRVAFLELVNMWNRRGLIGLPGDRPIYVFVAEAEAND